MSKDLEKQFQIPWYQAGLPFSCTQCGKCCTGSPGYVWITEEEMGRMAEYLNLKQADFKRLYVRCIGQRYALIEKKSQNHSCVFYQDQKCQVYAARPLQCRTYPFWQENLLSEANWKQAAVQCEGIHPDASWIEFETIEKFLAQQHKQRPEEHFITSSEQYSHTND